MIFNWIELEGVDDHIFSETQYNKLVIKCLSLNYPMKYSFT